MISPASSFSIPPRGTNVHPLRDSFILDTGTTRHITNSPTHFVEWLDSSQSSVCTGLQIIPAEGEGTIRLQPDHPMAQDEGPWTLEGAMFIPNFTINLISANVLERSNIFYIGLTRGLYQVERGT